MAFKRLRYSTKSLASMGDGFPDIMVGKHGKNWLFEIKDGSKPPSQTKLTTDEQHFFDTWEGHVDIIYSIDDVIVFHDLIQQGGK